MDFGKKLKERYSETLFFRAPPDLNAAIREIAKKEDVTVSRVVLTLVLAGLQVYNIEEGIKNS